jgi:hypothetical protein
MKEGLADRERGLSMLCLLCDFALYKWRGEAATKTRRRRRYPNHATSRWSNSAAIGRTHVFRS